MDEGFDKLINKGIITVEVKHPVYSEIVIHNTHMSSDCMFYPRELVRRCRRKQNDEIIKHILPSNKLSIFAGDLNDDHEFVSGFSKKLKYSLCNLEKLVTFEKTDMQLDYVLVNRSI